MLYQATQSQRHLSRARLLLEEGRYEEALATLKAIQTTDKKQGNDLVYLLGWCYIQLKRWHDALATLLPLLPQMENDTEQETFMDRERQALFLLRLGITAVNLAHYEDASLHFSDCLKVMHDRRLSLPAVRIKARYSLAMTYLVRGLYTNAIQHYEEALQLCQHYNTEDELAPIYHGLCDAYRYVGDLEQAYIVGEEALRLYQEKSEKPFEAQVQNLLGRISFLQGDFQRAANHYLESLAIAKSYEGVTMIMVNCAELADLRLAENKLEEAKWYCDLTVEHGKRSDNAHMRGLAYQTVGHVVEAEASQANEPRRRALIEEATGWYQRALDDLASTQAYTTLSEVYKDLARVLEQLGRAHDALICWRQAYQNLMRSTGEDL